MYPQIWYTGSLNRLLHFVGERVTSLHREEGWWFPDAALMSGLGRVVVYVCQQNRERGEEGGSWGMGPLVPSETWEQETHAPHFLSPLYQHLALCYFCSLKASDESPATDKCLCLLVFFFFYGAQMRDFVCPPSSFILVFASFLCLLWDATREVIDSGLHYGSLKMGLGPPKRTMLVLVLKKKYSFTTH